MCSSKEIYLEDAHCKMLVQGENDQAHLHQLCNAMQYR